MNTDSSDYEFMRKWIGMLTEFDATLDPLERRNRFARKFRVLACRGLEQEYYTEVFLGQREFFPAMGFWDTRQYETLPQGGTA
jgi:hypothetical protein